ncbi:DUF6644 family protein [Pseudorhodoplanes sp.]|uniref:DUF6644 family protein n=1 Tax=Pseudorhodoplanes sp. TaxID=1934341 RepID=UPI002CFF36BC|nr:DUF6644 family protein [Pseudorhodoplanes sp.]HWV52010.1 DUF6644 family protein [Pseudorhodoplanes sp.]
MTDAAPAIFIAIEGSAFAATVRQSSYAYMAANVAHILSLMVFFSAVAVMDLRLAGFFQSTWPGSLLRRARTIAIIGFIGLAASGTILFVAEASHLVLNTIFQIKVALIALGLINIIWFEYFIADRVTDVQPNTPLPGSARFVGVASLLMWFAVAACGRLIAYF